MNNFSAIKLLGAGIAMVGVLGIGIGQGLTASKFVEGIARNPDVTGKLRTNYIITAAITETGSLYALIVALLLIFAA